MPPLHSLSPLASPLNSRSRSRSRSPLSLFFSCPPFRGPSPSLVAPSLCRSGQFAASLSLLAHWFWLRCLSLAVYPPRAGARHDVQQSESASGQPAVAARHAQHPCVAAEQTRPQVLVEELQAADQAPGNVSAGYALNLHNTPLRRPSYLSPQTACLAQEALVAIQIIWYRFFFNLLGCVSLRATYAY